MIHRHGICMLHIYTHICIHVYIAFLTTYLLCLLNRAESVQLEKNILWDSLFSKQKIGFGSLNQNNCKVSFVHTLDEHFIHYDFCLCLHC